MATLLNFFQKIIDLPDGNRATVSAVKPLSNSDSFTIEPPNEDIEGASVTGFLESPTGGITAVSNFYVGSADTVHITNRQGQDVTVVSLSSNAINYASKRSA